VINRVRRRSSQRSETPFPKSKESSKLVQRATSIAGCRPVP
jgi:hypothetical protein